MMMIARALALCAVLLMAASAHAQSYPTKSVRIVVPFAAGGPTDVIARIVGAKLSESMGQQFYVENIPGAGGNSGTAQAARAPADVYTLLVVSTGFMVNPSMYSKIPYDPVKDFAPVTLVAASPNVISAHPSLPATTLKELVELVKANPGKYSFASPGVGTPPSLVGELFRLSYAPDLVHAPFNGGGPAVGSTVAGHTPASFGAMAPALPMIKDGKLRALAVASKTRAQALPDVPTMAESGFPDVEGSTWTAVVVPFGTPKDIIAQLHRLMAGILKQPDVKEKLAAMASEAIGNTPEECNEFFKAESAKWSKVIKSAAIRAD